MPFKIKTIVLYLSINSVKQKKSTFFVNVRAPYMLDERLGIKHWDQSKKKNII